MNGKALTERNSLLHLNLQNKMANFEVFSIPVLKLTIQQFSNSTIFLICLLLNCEEY